MTSIRRIGPAAAIVSIISAAIVYFAPERISDEGLSTLRKLEGFSATPYRDQGGVWTIGYGTIKYPDGTPVSKYDPRVSPAIAAIYMRHDLMSTEYTVNSSVKSKISQTSFDALVIFAYNVGDSAFKRSTLLKKINADPLDPSIYHQFTRWIYVKGKISKGLLKRRRLEANMYFSKPYIYVPDPGSEFSASVRPDNPEENGSYSFNIQPEQGNTGGRNIGIKANKTRVILN